MSRKLGVILFLPLVLLSGCWDVDEPERMLYIHGIGVDFKDGKYEVYVQIINFANTAKSEAPSTELPQSEVGYATGKTLDEAVHKLYLTMDEKVYWGHMSYMVVSEEVLKNAILSPVIDTFIRFRETRYTIWVYATKGSVEEVLLVKPVLNKSISLSKLSDPENSFKQESYVEPIDIRRLIIDMNEPGYEAIIPVVTVTENLRSNKESLEVIDINGVAVVTPEGLQGYVLGDQARGIQWMSNEMKRGQLTFKLSNGEYITTIIEKVNSKIEPVSGTGEARFDITVNMTVYISVIVGDVSYEELREHVIEEVEKEIRTTYEEALKKDIDIYGFSNVLYREKVKEWKNQQTDGKINLTESSIRHLTIHLDQIVSDRKSIKPTIEE